MILLKAQFQALRDYFTSLLPTIFEHDKEKDDKVWLAKYLLWKFERELLAPLRIKKSSRLSRKIRYVADGFSCKF